MTMSTANSSHEVTPHKVGYTILRAGAGADSRACLVSPFVGQIKGVEFERDAITLRLGSCNVGLTALPPDIQQLLSTAPERVLIVSVDTLSTVRQSGAFSEINSNYH